MYPAFLKLRKKGDAISYREDISLVIFFDQIESYSGSLSHGSDIFVWLGPIIRNSSLQIIVRIYPQKPEFSIRDHQFIQIPSPDKCEISRGEITPGNGIQAIESLTFESISLVHLIQECFLKK